MDEHDNSGYGTIEDLRSYIAKNCNTSFFRIQGESNDIHELKAYEFLESISGETASIIKVCGILYSIIGIHDDSYAYDVYRAQVILPIE